jgi:hypothetical protein
MIAASVQCDVDGIPKGSHYVRVPIAIGQPNELKLSQGSGDRKLAALPSILATLDIKKQRPLSRWLQRLVRRFDPANIGSYFFVSSA